MHLKKVILSLVFFFIIMYHVSAQQQKLPEASLFTMPVPDTFRAVFSTTKGDFTIEAYKSWSPQGVARLYQLIKSGYFNNNVIFRVQPDYVVQFGVCDDTALYSYWDKHPILDEPLQGSNKRGIISFASGGANTRSNQLFINKADNYRLDTIRVQGATGYPPVAKVIKGMDETVENFYSNYGRQTLMHQDSAAKYGNIYWEKKFPGLDRIISARLVE